MAHHDDALRVAAPFGGLATHEADRVRDVILAERVSLFERLRLGQIGRIQYLRRRELNVDNPLAFKLRNRRRPPRVAALTQTNIDSSEEFMGKLGLREFAK